MREVGEAEARGRLMQQEMNFLADEIEAGRRHIRNEDMAMILIALRGYVDPRCVDRAELMLQIASGAFERTDDLEADTDRIMELLQGGRMRLERE